MNTPQLETQRLILRRFTEADREALFRIFSDGEANRFLPWFPVKSLEEALAFYKERYAPVYAKAQGYAYAICRKEDNVPSAMSTGRQRAPGTLATACAKSSGAGALSQKPPGRCWPRWSGTACPLSPLPTTGRTPAAAG